MWNSLGTLVPGGIAAVIVKGGPIMIPLLAASMVIMNADGDVRHHAILEAMDGLQIAGVARLAMAVRSDRTVQS